VAIGDLLEKGYVRRLKSTWLSNLRPVVNPDGSIGVITNLVALNKLVALDNYPLPHIDRLIFSLNEMKYLFFKIRSQELIFPDRVGGK
jgi:hypothetical protein